MWEEIGGRGGGEDGGVKGRGEEMGTRVEGWCGGVIGER
jgi:hypothetical protein